MDRQDLKSLQLKGASPPEPLTRDKDPAEGRAPDPRYKLALRALAILSTAPHHFSKPPGCAGQPRLHISQ